MKYLVQMDVCIFNDFLLPFADDTTSKNVVGLLTAPSDPISHTGSQIVFIRNPQRAQRWQRITHILRWQNGFRFLSVCCLVVGRLWVSRQVLPGRWFCAYPVHCTVCVGLCFLYASFVTYHRTHQALKGYLVKWWVSTFKLLPCVCNAKPICHGCHLHITPFQNRSRFQCSTDSVLLKVKVKWKFNQNLHYAMKPLLSLLSNRITLWSADCTHPMPVSLTLRHTLFWQ